MRFLLANEPEGAAEVSPSSYSTSSVKAVGSIAAIRIVNSGGFYTKLPIISLSLIHISEPTRPY